MAKRKKFYLYAGYYEMYITDQPLGDPYSLISWHYSVEAAWKRAEKEHPDDPYFFKKEIYPEDLNFVLESYDWDGKEIKTADIQGQTFYII